MDKMTYEDFIDNMNEKLVIKDSQQAEQQIKMMKTIEEELIKMKKKRILKKANNVFDSSRWALFDNPKIEKQENKTMIIDGKTIKENSEYIVLLNPKSERIAEILKKMDYNEQYDDLNTIDYALKGSTVRVYSYITSSGKFAFIICDLMDEPPPIYHTDILKIVI